MTAPEQPIATSRFSFSRSQRPLYYVFGVLGTAELIGEAVIVDHFVHASTARIVLAAVHVAMLVAGVFAFRSLLSRQHAVDAVNLVLLGPATGSVLVPRSSITAVREQAVMAPSPGPRVADGTLTLPVGGTANVTVELDRDVEVSLGRKCRGSASRVVLFVDEPTALVAALAVVERAESAEGASA